MKKFNTTPSTPFFLVNLRRVLILHTFPVMEKLRMLSVIWLNLSDIVIICTIIDTERKLIQVGANRNRAFLVSVVNRENSLN